MNLSNQAYEKMSRYRWVICSMLFLATTVNYLDRQVLSLTWKDFIAPEFHWTDANYGDITAVFSIIYAIANLFAGRFIDWLGTKKGYLWAIGVWSAGASLHAVCGWATEHVVGIHDATEMISATGNVAQMIAITSVYFFIAARVVLALGEAGNFPAAIKVTAEYFPKKDRAYATSIFNAGAAVGALVAPVTIPSLAGYFQSIGWGNGWEMAFIVIGALGFVWMGMWVFMYKKPAENPRVNAAELAYIEQDKMTGQRAEPTAVEAASEKKEEKKLSFVQCLKYPQAWAFAVGKFMTDGVWWFFLFWTPAYLSDVFGYSSDTGIAQILIFVLYALTMLSIYGGKLPTIIINKTGKNPYAARMQAMFIFALFPLLGIVAQPLSNYFLSAWFAVIIIGILGAAHQSWSANIYSVVGDMFPNNAVATITGLGGMAGGIGSFLINKGSGSLFTYAAGQFTYNGETYEISRNVIESLTNTPLLNSDQTLRLNEMTQLMVEKVNELGGTITQMPMEALGFEGKPAGYMIIFCICAVAYLVGWCIMKLLVPRYKPIEG